MNKAQIIIDDLKTLSKLSQLPSKLVELQLHSNKHAGLIHCSEKVRGPVLLLYSLLDNYSWQMYELLYCWGPVKGPEERHKLGIT